MSDLGDILGDEDVVEDEEIGGLRREITIPIYWLVIGLAVMIVSPILSIFASVDIAQQHAEEARRASVAADERAQRTAQLAAAETREEARLKTCDLFSALLDVYVETPPLTEAGRNVQRTYLEFYTLNRCQPPRSR